MKRWITTALLGLAALSTTAQVLLRDAPRNVVPGMLGVTATPPEITIDGKPDRLSPGARIRNTNNMMVLSGALAGQTVPAVYRRDSTGLVHEVWLLTPEEYQRMEGVDRGDAQGAKRLAELLNAVFGARK